MTSEVFNQHLLYMQEATVSTLLAKAAEYATDGDRLHNFKVAADVQGISPTAALAGMMAKHTVSVYDMIGTGDVYPLDLWEEGRLRPPFLLPAWQDRKVHLDSATIDVSICGCGHAYY